MTDKKFLALLNLYLDGEIDSAGVANLEREILTNPDRNRVYTDYCRIHRATKLVCERFATAGDEHFSAGLRKVRQAVADAPTSADDVPSARRSGGRATPGPFRTAVTLAGGMAAACAFVVGVASALRAPVAPRPEVVVTPPAPAAVEVPAIIAATPPAEVSPAPDATTAAIAAPFATNTRTDPYVVDTPPNRPNPFALINWASDAKPPQYGAGIWNEVTPSDSAPLFEPAFSSRLRPSLDGKVAEPLPGPFQPAATERGSTPAVEPVRLNVQH